MTASHLNELVRQLRYFVYCAEQGKHMEHVPSRYEGGEFHAYCEGYAEAVADLCNLMNEFVG